MNRLVIFIVGLLLLFIAFFFFAVNQKSHLDTKKVSFKEDFSNKSCPTLVFVGVDWCPHCVNFKPVYDELVSECQAKKMNVKFEKYDGDKDSDKLGGYHIEGYPAIFIKNGDTVEEYNNRRDKKSILSHLKKLAA